MKKLLVLGLILLLLPVVLAVDYPKPISYVSDYAEIISAEDEAKINALAAEIQKTTTAEIAVLTVPDLQGIDKETYAVEIFKEWGIGKKDINNGLLILVGLQEREWRIEVGYGLEGLITDSIAGRIGREKMVPNFQAGNYSQGIYEAVAEIKSYLEGQEEVVSKYKTAESTTSGFDYFYVILFMALIAGGIVSAATKKIENKKVKWGVRIGVGLAVFFGLLLLWDLIIAILFIFLYLIMMIGGGRGGGVWFFGGGGSHGGGSSGGGFGGFGGGMSGGGGAGGRW